MTTSMPLKIFIEFYFVLIYAIQARELTQLQTILQNQVTQFGNHVFKDGSQVCPGEVTYTSYYEYVKLSAFSTTNVSDLVGETLTGATNGVQVEVVNSTADTETTDRNNLCNLQEDRFRQY